MQNREKLTGWLFAAFTITVWGSTFISSKKLLGLYSPAQIMLTRFFLAYCTLWLLRPRKLKLSRRQELGFLLLGLFGCSLYFYTENTALTYTLASNVSIIVAAAPIFTAILAHFAGEERFRRNTLWGFLVAFTGVVLVVCNGTFVLKLNPRGDLLALGAAASWAVYSVLVRKLGQGTDPILVTRRTLFWGILTAPAHGSARGKDLPHRSPADAGDRREFPLSGPGGQRAVLCSLEQGLPSAGGGRHQQFHLPDSLCHHRDRPAVSGRVYFRPCSVGCGPYHHRCSRFPVGAEKSCQI